MSRRAVITPTVDHKVVDLRKSGLSQREIADKLSVGQSSVSRALRKHRLESLYQDTAEISRLYLSGVRQRDIATRLHISYGEVRSIVTRLGISRSHKKKAPGIATTRQHSATLGYVVVSDPSDTFRKGAEFSSCDVLATLAMCLWPEGMILRNKRSGKLFKIVEGRLDECAIMKTEV
jgi:DNA-binding CsgD family transcriptional regulator